MNELIQTWEISSRLNLYLLNAVEETWLADQSASKGRSVGEQFLHLHSVRLMWLKSALPAALEGLTKPSKEGLTKPILQDALTQSAAAISTLITQGLQTGKISGFKPHPTAFTGYIIAHEAHHRGQIILSLKQCGHNVDKKVLFGLWEWGVR